MRSKGRSCIALPTRSSMVRSILGAREAEGAIGESGKNGESGKEIRRATKYWGSIALPRKN
jgi:hypothetical protein